MKKNALLLSALLMVAGCDSSTNNDSWTDNTRPTVLTAEIKGKLIDPAIANAKIELHTNEGVQAMICSELGTQPCQTGTDDNGNFTLTIKSGTDISKHKIVSAGGTDTVLGTNFDNVQFVSEVGLFDNQSAMIVSPITTLISAEVSRGATLEEATATVAKITGLSADLLPVNPMENTDVARRTLVISNLLVDNKKATDIVDSGKTLASDKNIFSPEFAESIYQGETEKINALKATQFVAENTYGSGLSAEELAVALNDRLKVVNYIEAAKLYMSNFNNSYGADFENSVSNLIVSLEKASSKVFTSSYDMMSALFASANEYDAYYGDYNNYVNVVDNKTFKERLDADIAKTDGILISRAVIVSTGRYNVDIPLAAALDGSSDALRDYYLRSNISNFHKGEAIIKEVKDNDLLGGSMFGAYSLIAKKYAVYGMYEYATNYINVYAVDPLSRIYALMAIASHTYKSDRDVANANMAIVEKMYKDLTPNLASLGGDAFYDFINAINELAVNYYVNGEIAKGDEMMSYLKSEIYDKLTADTDPAIDTTVGRVVDPMFSELADLVIAKDYDAAMALYIPLISTMDYYITVADYSITGAMNDYASVIDLLGQIALHSETHKANALARANELYNKILALAPLDEDGMLIVADRMPGFMYAFYLQGIEDKKTDSTVDPIKRATDIIYSVIFPDPATPVFQSRFDVEHYYNAFATLASVVTLVESADVAKPLLDKYFVLEDVSPYPYEGTRAPTTLTYKIGALQESVVGGNSYMEGEGIVNLLKDLPKGDEVVKYINNFLAVIDAQPAENKTVSSLVMISSSTSGESARYSTSGVYFTIANQYIKLGLNDDAIALYEKATVLADAMPQATASEAAYKSTVYGNLGKRYLELGDQAKASEFFAKARIPFTDQMVEDEGLAAWAIPDLYYRYYFGLAIDHYYDNKSDSKTKMLENMQIGEDKTKEFGIGSYAVKVPDNMNKSAEFLFIKGYRDEAIEKTKAIKEFTHNHDSISASNEATRLRTKVTLPLAAFGEADAAVAIAREVSTVVVDNATVTDVPTLERHLRDIGVTVVTANAFADDLVMFAGAVTLDDPLDLLPAFSDIDRDGKADFYVPGFTDEYIASFNIALDDDNDNDGVSNDADTTPFNYVAP